MNIESSESKDTCSHDVSAESRYDIAESNLDKLHKKQLKEYKYVRKLFIL